MSLGVPGMDWSLEVKVLCGSWSWRPERPATSYPDPMGVESVHGPPQTSREAVPLASRLGKGCPPRYGASEATAYPNAPLSSFSGAAGSA
jgi:hypothetical protein